MAPSASTTHTTLTVQTYSLNSTQMKLVMRIEEDNGMPLVGKNIPLLTGIDENGKVIIFAGSTDFDLDNLIEIAQEKLWHRSSSLVDSSS